MEGLTWALGALGRMFSLLEIAVLGIPLYIYLVVAFVVTALAKFVHGRR